MARLGSSKDFYITIAAPKHLIGDLRNVRLKKRNSNGVNLYGIDAIFTKSNHTLCYLGLNELFESESFDLVHIWEEPYTWSGFQISRKCIKRSIPCAVYSCQNLNKKYPPPFNLMEKYVISHANGWMACGNLVHQNLIERGYPELVGEILPLGVEEGIFYPNEEETKTMRNKLGITGPVIGIVGRLTQSKGFRILLPALERVSCPYTLIILGSGPEEHYIRSWSVKLMSKSKIRIHLVEHSQVAKYLRAMDILVAPSQSTNTWVEQFGRMIIEAFACKVAVIGSNSGEIPYVIGDCGIIVGETDIQGWANAIEKLLCDEQLRNNYKKMGYERCLSTFTATTLASSYKNFYLKILKNRK